jgi:hypothetical protein
MQGSAGTRIWRKGAAPYCSDACGSCFNWPNESTTVKHRLATPLRSPEKLGEARRFPSFGRCRQSKLVQECRCGLKDSSRSSTRYNPPRATYAKISRLPMSKKSSRRLLNRSCAWIREHWDAHNLDVPDDLLQQWIYVSDEEEVEPSGFYLAVFSFGYLQYDLVAHNVPPGVSRSFSASELLRFFQAWQMKLALTEVHRATHLRMKPLPLFTFPQDERIEAWAEVPLIPQ